MSRWAVPGPWRGGRWTWLVVIVIAAVGVAALVVYSASTSSPPRTSGGQKSGAPARSAKPPRGSASPAPSAVTTTSWIVYHGAPSGSGDATATVDLAAPRHAWTSPVLDGQIYGEPLETEGRVLVATEDDTVYALAADSGAVLWSTHLGTPVPAGDLPCGDITPVVGITGTPVVDTTRNEVFAVADEIVGGAPSHQLVGLDLSTGAVVLNVAVNPAGTDPAALLQRTGLALDQGNVVIGMGGNYGDCGSYHGWVESVPEAGGAVQRYEVDAAAGERQGAIWMGGAAPEVDAAGNIWEAAGNGSVTTTSTPYDGSDAVIELSPSLTREQYFAPASWRSDNKDDYDLGSTAPALLADGTVLQVGKSETGYLLSAANLGGIGGQLASAHVCTTVADGGDAVSGATVYVPCHSGLEAVRTTASPPSVSVQWTAASGAIGPPIIAGGLLWSIGGGTLYGISPQTGATAQRLTVGSEANHFPTPSVADGLLLAAGGNDGDQVLAFSGSDALPSAPSPLPSG